MTNKEEDGYPLTTGGYDGCKTDGCPMTSVGNEGGGEETYHRGLGLFYTVSMDLPPDLSLADSFKSDRRKAFYEHHKGVAVAMILILFLLPLVGVFVKGLSGAVLGVLLSVSGYYLAPYVLLKLGEWFAKV